MILISVNRTGVGITMKEGRSDKKIMRGKEEFGRRKEETMNIPLENRKRNFQIRKERFVPPYQSSKV